MEGEAAFGYTEIDWDAFGVTVRTTEPELFDWLLEEVKRGLYNHKIYTIQVKREMDLAGKVRMIRLTKLGYLETEVAWWLIQQMCRRGWEPISSIRNMEAITEERSIGFRKRLEVGKD